MQRAIHSLLLGLILAGCTSQGDPGRLQAEALQRFLDSHQLALGEPVNSVSSFQVRGFQTLDDHQVVLTAGGGRHYLVKMMGICVGLRTAFNIGFDHRMSAISPTDSIVLRGIRGMPQRCPIQEIRQLLEIERQNDAPAS